MLGTYRRGLCLAFLGLALSGCVCSGSLPTADIRIRDSVLTVKVAADPGSRACGLSQRECLSPDEGMLFVFPEPEEVVFWMRDTRIPLSIAFLDEDGRILSIHQARPAQRRERYASELPALYAIELNRGWFEQHQIAAGEVVEVQLPPEVRIR